MNIRFVEEKDALRIAEIYAPFIKTTITFENNAPDEQEFIQRIQSITQTYPWIVLEDENTVKGYAYLSSFNPRAAYQHTADLSIYLSEDVKGQGWGKTMCALLFELAKAQNIHRIVSLITEENTVSKAFHEKLGFKCQGILEQVGYKHERWLNVSFYVLSLSEPDHPCSMIPFEKTKAQTILNSFHNKCI